jgi:hypothetical protein
LRSIVTAFATSLVLCASILVGAPQASAAGTITLTPPADGKLFDATNDFPYAYALVLPANNQWTVTVTLTRPDGSVDQFADFLSDIYGNPIAGTSSLSLPTDGDPRSGTYTMTASLQWREPTSGVYHDEPPVTAQFKVLRLATRTTMTVSTKHPRFGGTVVFRTRSLIQERVGYRQYPYARVRLEGYRHGWKTLTSVKTFANGRATFRFTWHTHQRRVKVRTETVLGGFLLDRSTSAPVTIRVR